MYLSIIEFPANFEYGVDVNSSVECLKMLEVPSHYVYNFNSVTLIFQIRTEILTSNSKNSNPKKRSRRNGPM